MENIIRVQSLAKSYGKKQVVSDISFEFKQGEIVGILGPNGAGKSTTFYMILGLTKPNAGKIFFNDTEITRKPMYKRCQLGMAYLAQQPSIFHKLTVEENIMAILETMPYSRTERRQKLEAYLAELNLTPLARQKAYTLSGGERRKLEITRSLVTNPSFLLMDEPFAGVDPLAVADIQDIIVKLKEEKNMGIFISDHNVADTLSITQRSYIIFQGKILISGTSKELINDPEARKLYLGDRFLNPMFE
ncbi:MAG TPA: LPS export ABC transporter ATP-binding protein [Candidatus Cloacimonadota bacterium]|jgi:lipopolysaccharide export system ATP-binding protein|nr:LPS export ABC transporter ATP-binding protein [Candidatus Cloacimonadota bacterium]HOD53547.1 LPS export ABC transporter ATP-binding protein [Candidatus Cloacimonadota bacterium]HPM00840.1 LPS export ABC transporter ATP-binding protein [Candidatus Cloacimonadota bacterium]